MDKVAVVILNWNGKEMMRRFLPNVVDNSSGDGVTVYVVDNGSTDGSAAMICEEFPTVRLLKFTANHGFAGGYNKSINQIEAEYVVLLNSDVEVTSNWLEPLVCYMDKHPEVAACQPKIRSWRAKDSFEYAGACGGFIDKFGYPFCRGRIMSNVEVDNGQYDSILPIFWATGAALFIRRNLYQEVGGLDARFFAHMEEIDLCWRLQSRGYQLVAIPQSMVFHVGGATLDYSSPHKTYLNFRNNLIMLYKNLPSQKLKKVLRVRMGLDYLAILFFMLKGEFQNAKSVLKAREDFKKVKVEFATSRKENLSYSKQNLNGVYGGSIVFQYYIRLKRRFSQLKMK